MTSQEWLRRTTTQGSRLQEITRLGIPVQLTMFPELVGEVLGSGNEEREAGIATSSAKSSGPGPRDKTGAKVWRRQGRERSAADASLGVSEMQAGPCWRIAESPEN